MRLAWTRRWKVGPGLWAEPGLRLVVRRVFVAVCQGLAPRLPGHPSQVQHARLLRVLQCVALLLAGIGRPQQGLF